jgi:hypothetical protein
MKNEKLWAPYVDYTKALSEIARKLGFGAAAICWFFKSADNTFPSHIKISLVFVVLYFMLDMMQYLIAAVLLRIWIRREEKKKWAEKQTIEGDYEKPAWLDHPGYALWLAKVVLLLLGYAFIGLHLMNL